MEDMERYGDYNDLDDEEKGKPNIVGIILKSLIALVIFAVIGMLAFRMIIFNSYPASMQGLYLTDSLVEKYKGQDIPVMSQSNSVNYDDAKDGNFFFAHMMAVPEADHLQVSIRYNTSLITRINEEYGLEIDINADPCEIFDFALVRTETGYVADEGDTSGRVPVESAGELVYSKTDTSFMYKFVRLAFDGCDLGLDEGETPVGWVRLDITPKALRDNPDFTPYRLAVYVGEFGLEPLAAPTLEVAE